MISPGSVIVHNGSKLVAVSPSSDNLVVSSNSGTSTGVDWIESANNNSPLTILLNISTSLVSLGYETIGEFTYVPSEYGTITSIKVLSYMNNGANSYDIRIEDITNSEIISDENFTNTDLELHDLTLNNLPNNISIIEIQLQSNGGLVNNDANIKGIIIKFN